MQASGRRALLLLGILACLAIAEAARAQVVIQVRDCFFSNDPNAANTNCSSLGPPLDTTITADQSVIWRWSGTSSIHPHGILTQDGSNFQYCTPSTNPQVPNQNGCSGTLDSAPFTPMVVGDHPYECSVHLAPMSGTIHVVPGRLDHYSVTAPNAATQGSIVSITVMAFDQFNNLKTDASPVQITSSDTSATVNGFPMPHTFPLSNGSATFAVVFNSTGQQTLTFTDAGGTGVSLTTPLINVAAAPQCLSNVASGGSAGTIQFIGYHTICLPPPLGCLGFPPLTSPNPSSLSVSMPGQVISRLSVTINGFNESIDTRNAALLLVGPTGQEFVLMSGVGNGPLGATDLVFDDDAPGAPLLPGSAFSSGTYRPTAYGTPDFTLAGGPAGPYAEPGTIGGRTLESVFGGTNPNGTWSLYVVDSGNPGGGSIASWSLNIVPGCVSQAGGAIAINDLSAATPYPSQVGVAGVPGNITHISAYLYGFAHTFPQDVDVLLAREAGPQSLVFMSHTGGFSPGISNADLVFDDSAAPGLMPNANTPGGNFQPTAYSDSIPVNFPSPAPAGVNFAPNVGGSNFGSVFNSLDPNGTWSLYVMDDAFLDSGSIAAWQLIFEYESPISQASLAASTGASSQVNQPVTFTGTISSDFETPSGQVTFCDGPAAGGTCSGVQLGTPTSLVSGQAQVSKSDLTVGPHSITVNYPGNTTYPATTSPMLAFTVNPAATASVTTSSLNPSAYGTNVTLKATVTPAFGGAPTGSVTFKDGATILGTSALNSAGVATLSTNALTAGPHNITATYSGDSNFLAASSGFTQTVSKQSTTASLITSRPSGGFYGQSVTFTASVSASPTGPSVPGGTITFKDGATVLGTATVSSQIASLTCAPGNACGPLNVGAHSITAVYGGDVNYSGNNSSTLAQAVNRTSTTNAIASSLNPSSFGQSVTLTATITSAVNGVFADGTVTFCDGAVTAGACTGTTLGTKTLNGSGGATLAVANLQSGLHTLNALYAGSSNFNASDSTGSPLTQTVNKAATTTTVSVKENPAYLVATQDLFRHQLTLTATVTSASGTPGCSVTFKDNGATLGTVSLVSGKGSLTVVLGGVGKHTIAAFYSGCTNFNGSNGALNEYRSPKPH